jgi:hypothetical protein
VRNLNRHLGVDVVSDVRFVPARKEAAVSTTKEGAAH